MFEGQFKHHPDGRIYVDGAFIPLEDFLLFEPTYQLPEGWTGQFYDPVKKLHNLFNSTSEKRMNSTNWPEGDSYIAKKQVYLDAIEARMPAPPPEPTDRQILESIFSSHLLKTLHGMNNEIKTLKGEEELTQDEYKDYLITNLNK